MNSKYDLNEKRGKEEKDNLLDCLCRQCGGSVGGKVIPIRKDHMTLCTTIKIPSSLTNLIPKTDSPEVDPDLFALQVGFQACVSVTSEVGDVQAFDGNPKLLGQQLQGHLTGQLLQNEQRIDISIGFENPHL